MPHTSFSVPWTAGHNRTNRSRRIPGLAWLLLACVWVCGASGALSAGGFPAVEQLPVIEGLPDPLKMFDGRPVTTREQWTTERRPEIKRLFEHYMYGKAPPAPARIQARVRYENPKFLNGRATLRETTLSFGPKGTPPIQLLTIVPNHRSRPAPVFVGLNFCGNHAVVDDPGIAIPAHWMYSSCKGCEKERATEKGRDTQADVWCAETLVDRGYALATFYNGDIDPDNNDFTDGVHPHYLKAGQKSPGPHDWGTIAAWAWGLQRAVDYLSTHPDIDGRKVCAIGHSRLGKTALLAAAFDERIALVVPHQSGTGGCALSRDNNQETVERINRSFPHWFNDTFPKFGDKLDRLPIDQHLLMALVAPRPLLDTEGDQDKWANYDNALLSLQGADKVYKFLGKKGLVGKGIVHGDEPIEGKNTGELLQYRRDSKHVLTNDYWIKILDFADLHLGKPAATK